MTFEYFNTEFHRDKWKQKQSFTFWYCVVNFYPWKDIVGKKVSKLRSIAEQRAFYGTVPSKLLISSYFWMKNCFSTKLLKTTTYFFPGIKVYAAGALELAKVILVLDNP